MAKVIARTKPKDETRTKIVPIDHLGDLQADDKVIEPGNRVTDWQDPVKVERTVHEKVEGSITLELSEVEASVLKAILGKVNSHGDAGLSDASREVFLGLSEAKIQGRYIQVSMNTKFGALELRYAEEPVELPHF